MKKKKSGGYQSKQRRIIAVFAIIMALLMILPMVTMVFSNANATVSQSDIDTLKQKSEALESQKAELQSELSALDGKTDAALSQKLLVEQQITVLETQISTTENLIQQYQAQIDDLAAQIEQKQAELVEAEQKEADQFELFCKRVRSMEEEGTITYWAILFNSKDYSDLLDRFNRINEIMDYDNAVIESLKQAREAVQTAKTELETKKTEQETALSEQETVKAQLVSQKAELDSQKATINNLLAELESAADQYQSQMEELEEQTEAIDAQILQKQKQLEAQLSAQQYQYDTGTGYYWPLPGHYYISSKFGYRTHPIDGVYKYHNGVDIPASYGTQVLAARGGVVVTSSYHYSYGNYVVISHGNNDSTLYAHLSGRAVSEGDTVTQGQVIGYVGSTGSSTGNHLHFEIRIGGTRQNPLSCYPSLSFTGDT